MDNIILVDYNVTDQWEYKKGIEDETHESWKIERFITHRLQSSKMKKIIRYILTFVYSFIFFLKRNKYKKVIAWQQFYGLCIAFFCKIFSVKKYPDIYIMTFIYKPKSKLFNLFVNYTVHSKYIKKLIVLSDSEKDYYSTLLNVNPDMFYCTRIGVKDESKRITVSKKNKYYLSVGRSNRDYGFLRNAWDKKFGKLIIINDSYNEKEKEGITVLKKCYGDQYLQMVANCYAEIIPLDDINIASGSLSFLQAMMFSKPVIVTNNVTVREYITDKENGLLINNTQKDLCDAISYLDNEDAYEKISSNARLEYILKYSELTLGKDIGKMILHDSLDG